MNWASYLIQANLYLVCFYAFYWFILREETFFNLNRIYLLISATAATLIPIVKVAWFNEAAQPVQQQFIVATTLLMDGYASPIEDSWTFGDVFILVYAGVMVIMTVRLIYKFVLLNRLLKGRNKNTAFSFFKKIRISKGLPQQKIIGTHELAHAKHFHSADVLLFELLAVMNWFNPIIYLYKKSIKHIHEFIADEVVLKTETDKHTYALLLLSKNFGVATHTLTNNFFNKSLLKRRIEMMNKTKSRKTAIIKYGLSAPLFLLAMVLSSAKISESKTIDNLSEKVKPTKEIGGMLFQKVVGNLAEPKALVEHQTSAVRSKPISLKSDSIEKPKSDKNLMLNEVSVVGYGNSTNDTNNHEIFTNVEVLPSFPGGLEAFGKFLAQNLRYPDQAKKDKTQGRVFCQFVVEKDGSLSNIKVVRGIGGGCDEEAVRVLAISPKWHPGVQNGRLVRVGYTIPILFNLQEEKVEGNTIRIWTPIGDSSPENKPLLILDGKEFKGEISDIKSDNIKSINVLKDESATKKYGDKGKNGVIEITTKKK
ncbi:hypothetical protein BCY91_10520 [Pelobium manganitolerans]|uniref:TonB C-terminal domain-containing protein n=1 Tax=Pelobium manganitolerans TaxID=1842495 RepID=A0A419S2M3_9SPHI|nr:M56 family metallopeptidase [Pelobium manganitolerans]RKD13244.1 hypothetical protein BCY91_10520 [Pelobium manganitolerans]